MLIIIWESNPYPSGENEISIWDYDKTRIRKSSQEMWVGGNTSVHASKSTARGQGAGDCHCF